LPKPDSSEIGCYILIIARYKANRIAGGEVTETRGSAQTQKQDRRSRPRQAKPLGVCLKKRAHLAAQSTERLILAMATEQQFELGLFTLKVTVHMKPGTGIRHKRYLFCKPPGSWLIKFYWPSRPSNSNQAEEQGIATSRLGGMH